VHASGDRANGVKNQAAGCGSGVGIEVKAVAGLWPPDAISVNLVKISVFDYLRTYIVLTDDRSSLAEVS
jgi:hypothetical protein